jgi:ParB-like chromosome segregation protein Spo0J
MNDTASGTVTAVSATGIRAVAEPSLSLQMFTEEELIARGYRVTQAELARLLGTSRQSVSRWVKRGAVEIGIDGRTDAREAVRRILGRADPSRLRGALLRTAMPEVARLRAAAERVPGLEIELEQARAALAAALAERDAEAERVSSAEGYADVAAGRLFEFRRAASAAVASHGPERLPELAALLAEIE